LKTRLPVRSALFKQRTGGLVVRWVTTSEYPLLYVFVLFFFSQFSAFFFFMQLARTKALLAHLDIASCTVSTLAELLVRLSNCTCVYTSRLAPSVTSNLPIFVLMES
jgi:hypothetical protein